MAFVLFFSCNKAYSFQDFIPSSEGFLRVRNGIIALVLKRKNQENGDEANKIIDTINSYVPADRCPRSFEDDGSSNCYGHEDYGSNYYVSLGKNKSINVLNLNTLHTRTIFRKELSSNPKHICLSPDERFVSILYEKRKRLPGNVFFRSLAYVVGFYSRRLTIKTITLENDYFYHETPLPDWIYSNDYYEFFSLNYNLSGSMCLRHIIKPFREDCHVMYKKYGGMDRLDDIHAFGTVINCGVLSLQKLVDHQNSVSLALSS